MQYSQKLLVFEKIHGESPVFARLSVKNLTCLAILSYPIFIHYNEG